ncbi:MAG: hypothetical protein CXX68_02210 [Thaumarchaeota archaeon]|nr:MAG: hypothetical protein CXX68_02210 [Nitrososphaerota archaeon]
MSELESTTVDEITTKIKDLLDSRKNLVTQLKSLNKKRLDMRDEINTITSQLGEHQADLEPLYGEAGSYRKERQGLLNEKKQIWTQINDTNDSIKENDTLSKDQTSKTDRKFNKKENTKNISKQIKEIEWKIQTAQLSRQEEKQLIKNITTLQKKYNIWKKSTSARKELSALFKKIKQIGTNLDTIDKSRESAKASFDEKKLVFNTKFKQREQLFSEMNGFNDDIRELETTLKTNSKELQLSKTQRSEIFKSLKSFSKSEILKKKKIILEKEKSKAKEKLESGQSLSFDELRLAYDDDDEYLS